MSKLDRVIEELVTANRILARENIVDCSGISAHAIPTIRSVICFRAHERPIVSRKMISSSLRLTAKPSMRVVAPPISSGSSMERCTRRVPMFCQWCTTTAKA